MPSRRILVVEDEPDVRDILTWLFRSEGYDVRSVGDTTAARDQILEWAPHLIVLDVELPGESGLAFSRDLHGERPPIIMVSSHDRDDEVIAGLENGADDYVRKPFNNRELLLRVRKLLDSRTASSPSLNHVEAGDIRIDRDNARVWRGETEIVLTPTEWNILDALVARRGAIVSSADLLRIVWKASDWDGGAEMVKVSIRRLRKKIERDPRNPQIILNRWGRGYYVAAP